MDACQLLLLVFVLTSTSENLGTDEPTCEDYDMESIYPVEGEACYFEPYVFDFIERPPDEEFTWYRNNTKLEFSDENHRIHARGVELFLLTVLPEDSGLYTGRHVDPSGICSNYYLTVNVLKTSEKNNSKFFYGSIRNSHDNKEVPCPDPVKKTCDVFKGNITWFKDFSLLEGEHENRLWVKGVTKRDEGLYTCVCAWTYNNQTHTSSGSRLMTLIKKIGANVQPQIISPTIKEQLADEGSEIKLNCTVFSGFNAEKHCGARWRINGKDVPQTDRYKTNDRTDQRNITICTSTLTIAQVSAADFQHEFLCVGEGLYYKNETALRLKRRESIIPLVMWKVSALCFFVSAVALIKCFLIDLTLFFRPYLPVSRYKRDVRTYDAYVVYQSQGLDKTTEDTLYRFVTNTLPSVLEEKCGYRLFISGRDDIPGEDLMELVEERMKQSRRLMLILTLDSQPQTHVTKHTAASLQSSVMGGFDWQVGFHHALMQTELKVIVIQLGDAEPHGYTNLPPSLQHLIRKSPPISWLEDSRAAAAGNARFWKKVRYQMPAIPATKCVQASAC